MERHVFFMYFPAAIPASQPEDMAGLCFTLVMDVVLMNQASLPPLQYEEMEHTADVGIRAFGADLATLFVNAARGMMSLICPTPPRSEKEWTQRITVEAAGADLLLREWLGELLYAHAISRGYACEYLVQESTDRRFDAVVSFFSMNDDMKEVSTEIKAVTWHGLSVIEGDHGFEATVIFDT
jgi:SHS2 domain-containing protein